MTVLDAREYWERMMTLPRAGSEKILAFYDHRIKAVCRDPRLLLIPLDDHICHRGDGLFESICYRKGRILALEAHLKRLKEGAQALHIEPPCSMSTLQTLIQDVARASQSQDGDLRVFLSRGEGGFGISPSECPCPGLYIVALRPHALRDDLFTKGVTAFTSLIPPKQNYLVRIKNTNYLPNVFMAAEAEKKGMDVAVSFDEKGIMGEAATANIALLDREGVFVYPRLTTILAGTTLLAAIALLKERGAVREGDITHEDLWNADEVFLLTSSTLCIGVSHFDGKEIGQGSHRGKSGPFAHFLRDAIYQSLYENGTII